MVEHKDKLRFLDIRSWRGFYQLSYVILSIAIVSTFGIPDKTISTIILFGCMFMYLPFVIHEFRKNKRKKKEEF